jgi:hypothetical protein
MEGQMMSTIPKRSIGLLLGLQITLLPLSVVAQATGQYGIPEPKVGNTWRYRTIDLWNNKELFSWELELVEIQPDRLIHRMTNVETRVTQTQRTDRDLSPCRRDVGADNEVCVGALAFPLRVGDKYQYERQPWPNGNGYYSGKCKAAAAENVTVPAGTYETIRVECKGTWTRVSGGALSGNITQTLWYSTKVNRLVKWIFIDYKPSGKREADTKRQTEMIEFIQK